MEKPVTISLNSLIGHLAVESKEEQRSFNQLIKSLSLTDLEEKDCGIEERKFSFENSDIYAGDRIPEIRKKAIGTILKNREDKKKTTDYKVYRREIPIREKLLPHSMAAWGAGSKVDHSLGPFNSHDGRQFWFDFYPIETLVSMFIQGIIDPVLLFSIQSTGKRLAVGKQLQGLNRSTTFNLAKGSVWVNSKFLANNAPDGTYTGFSIKGGKINLNHPAQILKNKLTVPAKTNVKVQLDLEPAKVEEGKERSTYGSDARAMQLRLPQSLVFEFSGNGSKLVEVGESGWKLYGQTIQFTWNDKQPPSYHAQLQRIIIPLDASEANMVIRENLSDFTAIGPGAAIEKSGWVLPVSSISPSQPTVALGNGELFVQTKQGISSKWTGLTGGELALKSPVFIAGPGQLFLMDLNGGNSHSTQSIALWKEEQNGISSRVNLTFSDNSPFFYVSNANGPELLMTFANADFEIDRPVKVNGEPPLIHSLQSLLIITATNTHQFIYLFDDNLIPDAGEIINQDPYVPEHMALALTNALFKVTQPNGCLLFGTLSDDFRKVEKGYLFITFGLLAYIPTLPDPYAANLGNFQPIRGNTSAAPGANNPQNSQQINGWLVCRLAWSALSGKQGNQDQVEVSFHFAPLNNQFGNISFDEPQEDPPNESIPIQPGSDSLFIPISPDINRTKESVVGNEIGRLSALNFSRTLGGVSNQKEASSTNSLASNATGGNPRMMATSAAGHSIPLPDFDAHWEKESFRFKRDIFALLDVSTNADLFGISFDLLHRRDFNVTTHTNAAGEVVSSFFPVQVKGMDVVSVGANVKAFTVPQISWEPVFNLSPPPPPPEIPVAGDPAGGFNYYPDDGGPTHILNNSLENVVLAPLPLTGFLLDKRNTESDFKAYSFFTLPFGMKAAALLSEHYVFDNVSRDGGDLTKLSVEFDQDMHAGLQLKMDAGIPLRDGDSPMFMGSTLQVNNILDFVGNPTGNSTLGGSVTSIFNREFFLDSNYPFEMFKQRGVPVTRMDLSGYGASMFSNWLNTKAAIAETSQAKFEVFVGRCSLEIIQVKSILYPWGIKVVRIISLYRVGSGYVYRVDSGWRAESDGKFDFRYYVYENNPAFPGGPPENPEPQLIGVERSAEFKIHPGLVKALYNISNIIETTEVEPFNETITFDQSVDQEGMEINVPQDYDIELQPVYFDADIEVEGVISGMKSKMTSDGEKKVVPSKRVLGFVQLGPKGFPLNNTALKLLVLRQGTIGGEIDCEINLVESNQKMRLSLFDFNNSFDENGIDPVFCVAGRGNVLLPKDGSWSLVRHERGNGDVSPVPANFSVPVIRKGMVEKDGDSVKIDTPVEDVLTRIAEPGELLRQPVATTVNFGFLQSTDTQKALFLTPSFKKGTQKLLSKTPPLFVDAFRIVNSNGIFPNIGEADNLTGNTLGEAILMKKNGVFPFDTSDLQDLGKEVFELMDIQETINSVQQQGLQLLHNPEEVFDLPTEFELIDVGDGNFRIYIEYDKKDNQGNVEEPGSLGFDINSVAESWQSKMNNIGLVIDLAGIERLMTIRGNWDSDNSKEATYPKPDIKFAQELDPLVDLLEILQSLQEGNYGEAVQNGLKLAMSNKAGSWEYKFEASKEIPVIRFPVPDAVYNDPNTPFKLEAGLKIGAYFNAALKVTTDANELLPSAGGVLGFYARLSVMCVSVSGATLYAIGQAEVDIAADTKIGPSLRMKFGFGAQIVVGLPVAGNVSVLFVVGAEIFIAEGIVEVSAFLLFEGHAEILGGIVAITIKIEAKGTYSKKALGGGESRTDLQCQVTFALDISIAFIININISEAWDEKRRIA